MGKLIYGASEFDLDDRLLAHLQVITSVKLRRGENFFVTWRNSPPRGSGRQSVWIDNGLHIAFAYDGSRVPEVNREWIEAMSTSASTNFGLQLTDESGNLLNSPVMESR